MARTMKTICIINRMFIYCLPAAFFCLLGCANQQSTTTGQVGQPVFSPAIGIYQTPQTVTISTPTEGAVIRYCTDGSKPTRTFGKQYTGAISIKESTLITAIAFKDVWTDSPVIHTLCMIRGSGEAPVWREPAGGDPNQYFVAPGGSDSNPGTASAPFATIQRGLNSAIVPGSSVTVAGGTYRENLVWKASGTPNAPITLQTAPGATVLVDGAVPVKGWTRVENSPIYTAPWGRYFWGLYGDAEPPDARRLPRNQCFADGAWLVEAYKLKSMTPGSFFIDPTSTHDIFVWLADSGDPSAHVITATATDQSLLATGPNADSNLILRGIQFAHCANGASSGAVAFNGGRNILVENCTVSWAAASGYAFGGGAWFGGVNQKLHNSRAYHCGQNGVQGYATVNLQITGGEFAFINTLTGKIYSSDWAAGGIKLCGNLGTVIDGVVLRDNESNGIWFDVAAHETEIRNCVIANNSGRGIHYEVSYTARIHHNLITNTRYERPDKNAPDGLGIYISSSAGCEIYNNTVVGSGHFGLCAAGPVRDEDGGQIDAGTLRYVYSYGNTFHHNIVAENLGTWSSEVYANDVSGATRTNRAGFPDNKFFVPYSYNRFYANCYWNSSYTVKQPRFANGMSFEAWRALGQEADSVFADPLFVKPGSDFSISPGSPAKGCGYRP